MATISHPTRLRPKATTPPTFVVGLAFEGVARGVAGPFETAEAADGWVANVLGGEKGWSAMVVPLTPPDGLPTAEERQEARRRRRHLHVVR